MREFRREPLRNGEPERLLNACQTDLERALVESLLETGLRLAELCSIAEGEVNWEESRLRVRGKGDKFRVVPLSPAGAEAVRRWLELRPALSITALKRFIQRRMKTIGKRAGIERPVFPHLLRHSWAVKCLKHGISLRALQLMMGHGSLNVTAAYLSLSPDEVVDEFLEKWR